MATGRLDGRPLTLEPEMREVLPALLASYERGEPAAMATVVRTWRSAPRPAGASMLVTAGGEAVGSVSGGCVEGALYDVGQEVLATGEHTFETYGVSDDDAFAVGLTCGGILEVFVEQVSPETWPELPGIAASVAAEEPVAVATIVRGPHSVGRHLVVRESGVEGSLGTREAEGAPCPAFRRRFTSCRQRMASPPPRTKRVATPPSCMIRIAMST